MEEIVMSRRLMLTLGFGMLVLAIFLIATISPAKAAAYNVCADNGPANVRATADFTYAPVGHLNKGECAAYVGTTVDGEWYEVLWLFNVVRFVKATPNVTVR
jgi:hypothetical protein